LAHLRKQIRDNVVTVLTGLSTTGSFGGTPNVILIDVKAAIYTGLTRRRPRLSKIQKRLGVQLLTVDLEKGVCEF